MPIEEREAYKDWADCWFIMHNGATRFLQITRENFSQVGNLYICEGIALVELFALSNIFTLIAEKDIEKFFKKYRK